MLSTHGVLLACSVKNTLSYVFLERPSSTLKVKWVLEQDHSVPQQAFMQIPSAEREREGGRNFSAPQNRRMRWGNRKAENILLSSSSSLTARSKSHIRWRRSTTTMTAAAGRIFFLDPKEKRSGSDQIPISNSRRSSLLSSLDGWGPWSKVLLVRRNVGAEALSIKEGRIKVLPKWNKNPVLTTEWRFLDDYEFAFGGTMSFETYSPPD